MKRILLLALSIIMLSGTINAQTKKRTFFPKPKKFAQEISTIVGSKTLPYYRLSSEKESQLNITGPGTLKIISRAQFISGEELNLAYEINYTLNGGAPQKLKVKTTKRSTKATYLDGKMGIPGKANVFEIEVPQGNNTIELKLSNGNGPVAARYLFYRKKKQRNDWIDFAPIQSDQVIDLISHENSTTYYRFTDKTPLKIEVIGPTQLRIFSRVEYNYQMRGRVNYRIEIKNNNKIINTYQLSSRRSEITVYKNEKNLVPSKANEFIIDVPQGLHTYELTPLDRDKCNILGRVMILKKDVKKSK